MTPAENPADEWEPQRRILVILAHPDDPEFFCGASLAKWAAAGHHVSYVLLTCGDKGSDDRTIPGDQLCAMRYTEQQAAAAMIGAREVHFLDHPDGYLVPDIALRREITRLIRRERPDILVSCDPTNLLPRPNVINHPDHRATGQVVLDAIFPAAGNFRYFPELLQEGLEPHMPDELWLSIPAQADVILDVSPWWELKIKALLQHRSQIGDEEKFLERMRSRRTEDSTAENPRYEERFRVLRFL
jgi:LmbE family N-acetylglucosaminyl deacetylase